ncbi:MAG: type II toxin-antitoxin system RelE/ParE family toxin [Planctomycetota bacterium]|nr:MAG: type II toxin-antitoxin system RelE/ParE family toxin [Planctomycetota bacterium]
MIKSFRDNEAEKLWRGGRSKKLPVSIQGRALRKLAMLDAAPALADLTIPPSNYLELLKGNRSGQHSIRINKQWRLCFVWIDGNAHDVEITDYH